MKSSTSLSNSKNESKLQDASCLKEQGSRSKPLFRVSIPGRVAIKKNSKRIFRRAGGRVGMLSSERFLAWERPFIQKLRQAWGFQQHLEQPLTLIIDFYFKNRQAESDLDNCISGPKDCLQLAGVIANDKQIRRIVAEKHFGFEPSVELSLFNYEAGA